jgi:hypothetical protein
LLHPDAEAPRRRVGVDVNADSLEDLSGRLGHRVPVVKSEGVPLLATQEHVLGDSRIGNKTELLMDDANACCHRLQRMGEIDLPAVKDDRARISLKDAAHDVDERGLAGPILSDKGVYFTATYVEVDRIEHFVREETF